MISALEKVDTNKTANGKAMYNIHVLKNTTDLAQPAVAYRASVHQPK